ncbi:MAG: glycosyltransferase family 39 protein, partial [Planctomycetota bacterium]
MARRHWRRWLGHPTNGVLACVAGKLAFHLLLAGRYGFHRDELYYLAGAGRLDWGYVDYPPLTALLLRLVRLTLGDSLLAVRLLPALAGCAVVLLGAAMVRRFEGGKWAQLVTALSLTVAPVYLQFGGVWMPNVFDCLWWTIGAYVLIGLCDLRQGRSWIWLGVIGGLGLQTKHSMLFWGFGVAVAVLCTRQRRWLLSRQLWVGALIAAVCFIP